MNLMKKTEHFIFLVNSDIHDTRCTCYIICSNSTLLPSYSPIKQQNSELKNSVLFPLKALFPDFLRSLTKCLTVFSY